MRNLLSKEARALVQGDPNALFVDVRMEIEALYVGRPPGIRTVAAGRAPEQAGLRNVVNVVHGFEGELDDPFHRSPRSGWRYGGLPREQT